MTGASPVESLPALILRPRAESRLRGGHCWIYSNEVDTAKTPLAVFTPGDTVQVIDASGKPVGVAYVNPHSLICARLLSRKPEQVIGKAFFRKRIARALEWRQSCFSEPYYRLVYGEGDGLPGLVVDRFGDVLVAQFGTAGIERHKEAILDALEAECKPAGILLRNVSGVRELEGLDTYTEVARGQVPDLVPLVENGVKFVAPVMNGQKTGWFFDHRLGRAALMPWVREKRVLDVFSYVGGWGVQALAAGATEAVLVDSSESALDIAVENATLNGCADRIRTVEGQALDAMRELIAEGERFDVVIVDPPAFIKRRKDMVKGEQGYRRVNELAMRLLAKDGLLVSASCSLHLAEEKLADIVRGAARHVDREARIVLRSGLGPDHPVPAAIPEANYLKTLFCRLLPAD